MTLVYLNALICSVITIRLMFFRQENSQHKWSYSLLAYILIVSSASIVILALTNHTQTAQLPEVVLNAIICYSVIVTKGNVAKLFRGPER